MRKFLFEFVARVFASLILATQWLGGRLCTLYGHVGYFLMSKIDSKRLAVQEKLNDPQAAEELKQQDLELKLLSSAGKVRDHAKENDWTDHHTEAINAIGDALVVQAGWAEEHVHAYLKGIVESIDGLEYGAEEW